MLSARFRLASLIPLLVVGAALPSHTSAQVPADHAIVATHSNVAWPGIPGLFLFPLNGGPTTLGTPITGLPPELNTVSPNGQLGAWAVSLRSSDGAVLVTTNTGLNSAVAPGEVKLFVLQLSGTAVASYQEILLGIATANAAINHAQLPDGRVFVTGGQGSSSPITGGPMAGFYSAIVDLSGPTPTITTVTNPTFPAGQVHCGGVAIDPTGQFAYLLRSASYHGTQAGWSLARQELTPPYGDCVIASNPNESAHGINCNDDGTVYVSSSTGVTASVSTNQHIHAITPNDCNPATMTTVTVPAGWFGPWGLDFDRASGLLVATTVTSNPGMGKLQLVDPSTGTRNVIGIAPPGGWSLIGNQGVAVNNAIHSYGPRSDGMNHYWFENFPNPSGQPFVGNAGFSLSMAAAPGAPALSVLGLSTARSSVNVIGIEVLVDPSAAVVVSVPSGTSSWYALPIPATVNLAGMVIVAQSVHLETNGQFAASRGLEFEVQLLPAPTISSITPAAAVAGATVTVQGADFYPGIQLQVAGNTTAIVSQTSSTLTFVMPAGLSCNAPLSLNNPGSAPANGIVNAAPVVVSSTPAGPAAGGNLIVVAGSYLTGAVVQFNGVPMTNILSQSSSAILGYAPAGSLGVATLAVIGPTGCQSTHVYTYQ